MSDVSAVCLSLGEETTGRALESIARQTAPVADTILVQDVEPFHRAFNAAVAAVATPYFIQVDADMVLDPTCVAELRALMRPDLGIVGGLLRDALLGRVPAVKLFRTACLAGAPLPNTVAPEVDHYRAAGLAGWPMVYALRHEGRRRASRGYTFGEHRPDYTPSFTYSTYFLLGSRYRYLSDLAGLRWRLRELAPSPHPLAALARLALGHGVFSVIVEDVSKSSVDTGESDFLVRLLRSPGKLDDAEPELERCLSLPLAELFERLFALGARIGRSGAGRSLVGCLSVAARAPEKGWLAEVALAHGVLAPRDPPARPADAFEMLAPLPPRS